MSKLNSEWLNRETISRNLESAPFTTVYVYGISFGGTFILSERSALGGSAV